MLARHDILKSHITNIATNEEDCNAVISKEDLLKCIVSNFSVFNDEMALKVTNGIGELNSISADELTKQVVCLFICLFVYLFIRLFTSLEKGQQNS